jgi:hypothetical protein
MFKNVNGIDVELTASEIAARQAEEVAVALTIAEEEVTRPIRAREAAYLSREDFCVAVAKAGWVTEAEAEDWAAGVAAPNIIKLIIGSLPAGKRFAARVIVRSQGRVKRNDRMVLALQNALTLTNADVDAVFGINQNE